MSQNISHNEYVLAVDGGGTKTTAWIADKNGKIIGRGTFGPMSLAATTQKVAVENLLEAVKVASAKMKHPIFSSVVIGLAGVDTPKELRKSNILFRSALETEYSIESFELVNDVVIALESGTENQNAICLISGTGSNCFGHNERGDEVKIGGVDYLLSDQGSGFDIGQQVLQSAVKSFDGRSRKTVIENLLCQHFKIDSIADLKDKVYQPRLNKTQIGELARLCFEAHEQQDTIANEILNQALDELSLMVSTAVRRLKLEKTKTDVVLVGGIATDPYMRRQLRQRLKVRYPQLKFVIPEEPPVSGALKIALRT